MPTLLRTRPILHALVWILAYIVLVNIGDNVGAALGLGYPWLTGGLLVVGAAVLGTYVIGNGWSERFGLVLPGPRDRRVALAWLPLLALAVAQFDGGLRGSQGLFWSALVEMTAIAFIEEVLFRGFLFRAIEHDLGMWWAVIIAGVTFGLGHVVNLARGYSAGQQVGQIVAAVLIGVMLTLLVAATGSLLPGIIFHLAFNVIGIISPDAGGPLLPGLMVVVTVTYGAWLVWALLRARRLEPVT